MQNISLLENDINSEIKTENIDKSVENSFFQLDMKKIIDIANEFNILKNEIFDSNQVVGIWDIGRFKAKIYKSKNKIYFLEYLGDIVKLNKINYSKFSFLDKNDTSFIEILENGNLIYKDEVNSKTYPKIDN